MFCVLADAVILNAEWLNGVIAEWLRRCIPNPGVPCSKQLGGSKVDSAFHPSEVEKGVPEIPGDLVKKVKLPPRSGSSLYAVEPHP